MISKGVQAVTERFMCPHKSAKPSATRGLALCAQHKNVHTFGLRRCIFDKPGFFQTARRGDIISRVATLKLHLVWLLFANATSPAKNRAKLANKGCPCRVAVNTLRPKAEGKAS